MNNNSYQALNTNIHDYETRQQLIDDLSYDFKDRKSMRYFNDLI